MSDKQSDSHKTPRVYGGCLKFNTHRLGHRGTQIVSGHTVANQKAVQISRNATIMMKTTNYDGFDTQKSSRIS